MSTDAAAAERKRKRLEAWRRKRAAAATPAPAPPPKPKISLSLGGKKAAKPKQPKPNVPPAPKFSLFGDDDEDDDDLEQQSTKKQKGPGLVDLSTLMSSSSAAPPSSEKSSEISKKKSSRRNRWDSGPAAAASAPPTSSSGPDALDQFMQELETEPLLAPDENRKAENVKREEATKAPAVAGKKGEEVDENEEAARRALIQALVTAKVPDIATSTEATDEADNIDAPQTASEVKSIQSQRQERLRELEQSAMQARQDAEKTNESLQPEFVGRLYNDNTSENVMEEAERKYQAAQDALNNNPLLMLAELNKKKELKAVNHDEIDYLDFTKNLYRVPRSLSKLSHDEVISRRAKLKVRVRGHGAPAPVSTFEECGLSEKILQTLYKQEIMQPFPVQAQCIPCIMAGRDVIGIAKTGSGKTLAYLLPLLRHILAQPALGPYESGPIGLILAPARELAFQIHVVCKSFCKVLGLKSTAVYGGAGVAEQIADLKRGTHIVVATPGRLIDILTMQSGKILSLQRVTYVVADESDRMYDMGFAPQISAVLAAIRPDRQFVLFSATFPKTVEALARKSLQYPIQVLVGGRSVASDNVTQHAELVEEDEKFLRLLQLLGEQVEGTNKVIVFVDTQVRADSLFEQLLRNGYPSLSLHGGKEQEDRDSTIADFKRKDGPGVLVATGVAARGLDVPLCGCVVNYSSPNHLEAYVHQVGRTGRAGNKGVSYTFCNSADEAKFAPIVVRALSEAGQAENVAPALKELAEEFKQKVEKGEAKYAGSGFKGKGYSYDSTELSETQKRDRMEKRQALIEEGMLDPEDEDPVLAAASKKQKDEEKKASPNKDSATAAAGELEIPENLTPEILALPGMKEALLRKAGIVPVGAASEDADPSSGRPVQMGDNHWLQEMEINDYPREARWKVTQRETTSRLQEEFRTAVTLKGSYFAAGREPPAGSSERKLYLHLEATSELALKKCVAEIQRLLNEETLRVGSKNTIGGGGGGNSSGGGGMLGVGGAKYSVLG